MRIQLQTECDKPWKKSLHSNKVWKKDYIEQPMYLTLILEKFYDEHPNDENTAYFWHF